MRTPSRAVGLLVVRGRTLQARNRPGRTSARDAPGSADHGHRDCWFGWPISPNYRGAVCSGSTPSPRDRAGPGRTVASHTVRCGAVLRAARGPSPAVLRNQARAPRGLPDDVWRGQGRTETLGWTEPRLRDPGDAERWESLALGQRAEAWRRVCADPHRPGGDLGRAGPPGDAHSAGVPGFHRVGPCTRPRYGMVGRRTLL